MSYPDCSAVPSGQHISALFAGGWNGAGGMVQRGSWYRMWHLRGSAYLREQPEQNISQPNCLRGIE